MLRTIEFLDASGHLALEWDPTNPADVERARRPQQGDSVTMYSKRRCGVLYGA